MSLFVNTNVSSINAQRQLFDVNDRLNTSFERLSSGFRINIAADDAAGLAISENLRGQIAGVNVAKRNASNAVSLIQVSEGGLNEINNVLIRLRELGVQAASDNVSDVERSFLDQEAQQLIQEADRIAKTTKFGNKSLLDGSGEELEFHVGPFAGEDNIIGYQVTADATGSAIGYEGISVTDKDAARDSLQQVDDSLIKIGELRADFGAVQSRMNITVTNLNTQYENLNAANSRLRDTDVAFETAELASAQILQQAAVGVLAQANGVNNSALRLLA